MKNIHLIALLLAGTAAPSVAQRPEGPPPDPVIMAIDKNNDQKLSSREIRGAAKALLKLDKNRDKTLSQDELRPEPPKERRRRKRDEEEENQRPPAPPASAIFSALDTDSSGDLSEEELAAAAESLAKLDQDENGKLDSEEAGLKRPEQGEDERGGRPQGGGNGPPPGRGPRR